MQQEEIIENEENQDKMPEQNNIEQEMPDDNVESQPATEVETAGANGDEHGRKSRRKRVERQMDELNAKVEDMGMKLAEMKDKYMRIYSEYENYRKRTSAEKAGLILNGGKDVIKLMLPIIDDMERAIANMSDTDSSREGLELILKNMLNSLQQKGLKPMEAMGAKFDENFHEAITQMPSPDPEAKGTVIDVVKKGYFLNDEVLRFAQVVVAN